jgi:hypothetical protein
MFLATIFPCIDHCNHAPDIQAEVKKINLPVLCKTYECLIMYTCVANVPNGKKTFNAEMFICSFRQTGTVSLWIVFSFKH